MTNTTGEERILSKEVTIDAALEAVWHTWTTEAGLSIISAASRIDLRPGGDYAWFLDLPPDEHGKRGSEGSTIVAVDPMRSLVFDWNFPPDVAELRNAGATTRVTVTLTPGDDGIRVHLEALGWGQGEEWYRGYAYFDRAWGIVLERMGSALGADTR